MEFSVALVLACLAVYAQGCTLDLAPGVTRNKNGLEKDEMKVYFSEAVVFGFVKEIKDTATTGVKSVKFEVMCSYKGNVPEGIIYISGIGNRNGEIPGCPKAVVQVNQSAAMFLKKTPEKSGGPWYDVEFAPLTGDHTVYLDDLTFVCGLELNQTDHGECYEPIADDECEAYSLPTTTAAPATSNKVTPDVVVGPPKSEENTDTSKNSSDQTYDTKNENPDSSKNPGKVEGSRTDGGDGGSSALSISAILVLLVALIAPLV